jgi:glycerol uptake facilitator-like aquaporin
MTTIYLLSGMVGIMLFFTVVVAPTVFKVLPVEWSSKYVRNFFPKYYATLGLVTIICVFTESDPISKLLLAICALLFIFTLFYLTGKINSAKDSGQNRLFHILHGASVVINVFQLASFIFILLKSS